jgi:hypothetical protein
MIRMDIPTTTSGDTSIMVVIGARENHDKTNGFPSINKYELCAVNLFIKIVCPPALT